MSTKTKTPKHEGKWIVYDVEKKSLMIVESKLDEGRFLAVGQIKDGACNGKPVEFWIVKIKAGVQKEA